MMNNKDDIQASNIGITLTAEECKALYNLINDLSGDCACNVFAYGGDDEPDDPRVSACVKVYVAAGKMKDVPIDLLEISKGRDR
jgi:hypothetical protein